MVDSEVGNKEKKSGVSKVMLGVIIGIIVVIVGVIIFFSMGGGYNQQLYFLVEEKTMNDKRNNIEDRYDAEFDWLEDAQEEPTKSRLDISGEYNDPNKINMGSMFDVGELLNNSTILMILSQTHLTNR